MLRAIALLSTGLLAGTAALAADNGIYIGAAITQSNFDVSVPSGATNLSLDDDDNGFKIIAGVRPLDWFAVEANYVDFGSVEVTAPVRAEYKLKGLDAFAIGLFEVGLVDFFGKVGAVYWDQEASIANINIPSYDDTGFDPAFGGGIQAHFGSLSARLEYEMFDIDGNDVDVISLGVTWTFL